MLPLTTIDPLAIAWIGAIFLLFGEIGALFSMPRLPRVIVVSTVAEVGYVLIGLGLGGAAGETGAWLHVINQVVMRGPRRRGRLLSHPALPFVAPRRPHWLRAAHAGRRDPVRLRHVLGDGPVALQGLVLQVPGSLCGDRTGPLGTRRGRHRGVDRGRLLLHRDHPTGLPGAAEAGDRARARTRPRDADRLCARCRHDPDQPVAGAVPARGRAHRPCGQCRAGAGIREPVGDDRAAAVCGRLRRLGDRPAIGNGTRRRRDRARHRDRPFGCDRPRPRPDLAPVRASVRRHRRRHGGLFHRLHGQGAGRQPLLLLRLPDDRLPARADHGARVRQLLRLLGTDDVDVVLPRRPAPDRQGASRRPRLFPDVRRRRLHHAFRHPSGACPGRLVRVRGARPEGRRLHAGRRFRGRELLLHRLRGQGRHSPAALVDAARLSGGAVGGRPDRCPASSPRRRCSASSRFSTWCSAPARWPASPATVSISISS